MSFGVFLSKLTDIPLPAAVLVSLIAAYFVWMAFDWDWDNAWAMSAPATVGYIAYEAFFAVATGRFDPGALEAALACVVWALVFRLLGKLLNFVLLATTGRSL